MEESEEPIPEKRYRQVKLNVPERLAWRIEKKIGPNNINALVKIFLHNFAFGKAGLDFTWQPTDSDMQKILKEVDKEERPAA